MNRRRAAVAGASLVAAVALTGCNLDSKPTALVTVVNGDESEHAEARCRKIQPTEDIITACLDENAKDRSKPKVLKVTEGSDIGVGVEPSIADQKWQVVVGSKGGPIITDKTYYSGFKVPIGTFEESTSLPIAVVEYKNDEPYNIWLFKLEKR